MAAAIEVQPVIKVAALCGSLRKASFNRGLIRSGFLSFPILFTLCITSLSRVLIRCFWPQRSRFPRKRSMVWRQSMWTSRRCRCSTRISRSTERIRLRWKLFAGRFSKPTVFSLLRRSTITLLLVRPLLLAPLFTFFFSSFVLCLVTQKWLETGRKLLPFLN